MALKDVSSLWMSKMATGPAYSRTSGFLRRALFHFSLFVIAMCVTCLYLGSRGVMRLGGFVASGGPYVIAHPAPNWIWILPVSILLGMIFFFVNLATAPGLEGPNLVAFFWSAVFTSLGWNFLEFGLHPPGGQGLSWGWLVCAIFFLPMGLIPLVFMFSSMANTLRELSAQKKSYPDPLLLGRKTARLNNWLGSLAAQVLVVALGIYCGFTFFRSNAQPSPVKEEAAKQDVARQLKPNAPPTAAMRIQVQSGGRTLELRKEDSGHWRIFFRGVEYSSISDLPQDAGQAFQDGLQGLQDLLLNK